MAEQVHTIDVQVCYAGPPFQFLQTLSVPVGTTLQQAILQSGVQRHAAEMDLTVCKVGIYGKIKPLDTILRERDRIEIYRPLTADPKDARRKRAPQVGAASR